MQRSSFRPGALGLLLGFSALAQGADGGTALDWVKRMNEALRSLDYEGVFVVQREDSLQTVRVKHQVTNNVIEERLLALDGPAREIVRAAHQVTCVLPDAKSVLVDQRARGTGFGALTEAQIEQLHGHYQFSLKAEPQRVAGRQTRAVAIEPRDGFRYGYQFWLDVETALPVKTEMRAADGKAIERILFTELNSKPANGHGTIAVGPSPPGYKHVEKQEQVGPITRSNWEINGLPPGFALSSRSQMLADEDAAATEHWVFSDGLAALSVYIEHNPAEQTVDGPLQLGAVSVYGHKLSAADRVTVVGEVPMASAKQVGESVTEVTIRVGP